MLLHRRCSRYSHLDDDCVIRAREGEEVIQQEDVSLDENDYASQRVADVENDLKHRKEEAQEGDRVIRFAWESKAYIRKLDERSLSHVIH